MKFLLGIGFVEVEVRVQSEQNKQFLNIFKKKKTIIFL